MKVCGIVLAAGKGERMGTPKALLPWRGTTFLAAALDLLRARLSTVVVVLDPASPIHREAARLTYAKGSVVADNPEPSRGMLSSIVRGLSALPPEATHALLLPVDHPGVKPATLDLLLARLDVDPTRIVVPSYAMRRGHPAIYSRDLWPEIVAAPAEQGARVVLRAHPERVLHVAVDDEATVRDFDTPSDLSG